MVVPRGYQHCPSRILPCDADRECRLDKPAYAVVDRLSGLQESQENQLSLLVLGGDSVKLGPTWCGMVILVLKMRFVAAVK